jgi:hypothetical protein
MPKKKSAAAIARAERRKSRRDAIAAAKAAFASKVSTTPRKSFYGKCRRGDQLVFDFHFDGGSFPFDPNDPSKLEETTRNVQKLLTEDIDPTIN